MTHQTVELPGFDDLITVQLDQTSILGFKNGDGNSDAPEFMHIDFKNPAQPIVTERARPLRSRKWPSLIMVPSLNIVVVTGGVAGGT